MRQHVPGADLAPVVVDRVDQPIPVAADIADRQAIDMIDAAKHRLELDTRINLARFRIS